MSGYHYPPHTSAPDDEEFDFNQLLQAPLGSPQPTYQSALGSPMMPLMPEHQMYQQPQQFYQPQPHHYHQMGYQSPPQAAWATPIVPSNYTHGGHPQAQTVVAFPQYTDASQYRTMPATAGPSEPYARYLSPDQGERTRTSRAESFTSNASSVSQSDLSRSTSPKASEMAKWGFPNSNGTWSCAYPGCTSRSTFSRGCDLRKHYRRHTKTLFCRHEGCPQATEGGFSSKKDRARHEGKHNPTVACDWPGCDRMFSRVDNMKDHVRRVHRRRQMHE